MQAPKTIRYRGRTYEFDCIGGTDEPIYSRLDTKGNRYHVILIDPARPDQRTPEQIAEAA